MSHVSEEAVKKGMCPKCKGQRTIKGKKCSACKGTGILVDKIY
jgi:DnaJ-class molecular chaperone